MPLSNAADNQRTRRLYYYLCACLAMKRKADGSPNYKGISDRISEKDLRKIVSSVLQEEPGGQEDLSQNKIGSVTTGNVVAMLVRLREQIEREYRSDDEPYTRVLTQEDVLSALYQLTELTAQERSALRLSSGDGLTLLQQALLILQTTGGLANYEMLLQLYKAAVGLDFAQPQSALSDLKQVDALITEAVQDALNYLPKRSRRSRGPSETSPSRDDTLRELTLKAQREIRRLMARSGNQQSLVPSNTAVDNYIRHYLQPAFVVKLAQTVVTNERLTDQFPVYLKRVTLEPSGPLPFADKDLGTLQADGPYPALLHPALRWLDQGLKGQSELPGPGDYELASQEATKIVVEFYIKLPQDYRPAVARVFRRLTSEDCLRIDFFLESTGIGGSLSHVIKVINTALLSDITCLKEFFSIAHDVTCTQTIIRDNVPSPVWAHSLVKLCRKATVGETLQACDLEALCSYETFAFSDPTGHGDYCGFDFLLSQAQAALQARLQAIRNSGVTPKAYIQQLCQRIEHRMALKDAWSYLQGYPFSSLAMIGAIDEEILQPNVGERALTLNDPYIYFDACLSIVEALLDEGAYRPAYRYLRRLEILEQFVQQGIAIAQPSTIPQETAFGVFSGALTIRYLLCLANYYYLYDTSDHDPQYRPPSCGADINREGLIQRAWRTLDYAQLHVAIRLRKYVIINEVSQGTFHPHYCLLARIAFLRAKMLLFFPRFVPPRNDTYSLPTDRFSGQRRTEASIHWGRLYLAEKARLYTAANGDSELYACYAAMQCWFYLMATYSDAENLPLPPISSTEQAARTQSLPRDQCLRWAKQLRDHALISYADTGRQCYYQVKEKSGLPKQSDEFGRYCIQKLPAIFETRGDDYEPPHQASEFLVLDMSLLAVNPDELPKMAPNHPTRSIYLFGTNACYLFFARGMYLLCSDVSEEFAPLEAPPPIQWETKLQQATRLLNIAWAIAEEGGSITRDEASTAAKLHITRPFKQESHADEYLPQEVASVRDLYPRRVTEIVDLAKVFSAACMVLQLYLTSPEEQAQLIENIQKLLNTLHSAHQLSRIARGAILFRQSRYNGHIHSYLVQAKNILLKHMATAQAAALTPDLKRQREALLKALFSALQD